MPKRNDLRKILVIGAGPIIIGQGCEFDYSGSQAVKALREEGYEVVLVNSNPATIMTDPHMADSTYIEPLEHDTLAAIIRKERPDALLPTLGGQTALNAALELSRSGVLDECGVEIIGARADVIEKAESRELFRECMANIGLKMPASGIAHNMDAVRKLGRELPFPLIIRPAFTLGGTGGGVAHNMEELEAIAARGLSASPINEVMIEQSVLGWKEIEMEVMRDKKDNCVIVCSIENFDPMGVHTGDSITVAPVQTLTDAEYQKIRDASIAIMREIGVETGGSNVQFAVNPENGELIVIEMNPRVSRSSALASKATGFPIAKIAAKLAIGYTLDELRNDITRETVASFEPAIDYVVLKVPRFTFEKFPGAKDELTTSMKSVGEAMSIGRTFKEALQKGLRSMEIGAPGLGDNFRAPLPSRDAILENLRVPNSRRIFAMRDALLAGMSEDEIFRATGIDPWFIRQLDDIVKMEKRIRDWRKKRHDASQSRTGRDFARGKGIRLFGQAAGRNVEKAGGRHKANKARNRRRAHLLSGGYLRRRVRGLHSLFLFHLRARQRNRSQRQAQGADFGRRPQPHRPGHRIRLLLLPCQLRPQGRRHHCHHGKFQSRNCLDRL